MVPVGDTKRQYLAHREEFDAAIRRVLERSWFILGEEGTAFEAEFAAYLGVGHTIGVANGTDAIELALRALGIGPGDEVIVPPLTANLDPAAAAAKITPQTKALLVVHLYGGAADLGALGRLADERGLALIEDAAQAHGGEYEGRRLGGFGPGRRF